MGFETVYYFMNENITLVEIKNTEVPTDSPKDKIYLWLTVEADGRIEQLSFESMAETVVNGNPINVRKFSNAELRFDNLYGQLVLGDKLFILKNCSEVSLPEKTLNLLKKYIKS